MATYITKSGDTVDYVIWKYYGRQDNGLLELVLSANPGLADRGPSLPAGVSVTLPDGASVATSQGVRLWD